MKIQGRQFPNTDLLDMDIKYDGRDDPSKQFKFYEMV